MEACHSPQQYKVTSYGTITVAITTLEAFAGMWINAFIVCVLSIGWITKKTLNSNEILLLLGCSRICSLCVSWAYALLSFIYPNYLYVHPILQILTFSVIFFNFSNLWVSASLCVFYCIKIANFRNTFFIYLKVKIDRMVPWLLLGSVLSALALGSVICTFTETVQGNNLTITYLRNFWDTSIRMDKHFTSSFFLAGFGYASSFMAVVSSALFLLFSLWRHKRKMQTNSMEDLNMEAHIKAMKSILSFLVMYTINFVCLILSTIYAIKNENTMTLLIFIYLHAFPGVHSLILIFSNPKLEKALLRILSYVK
ncbi:taste receptor type 2 member 105-like [Prinia subflava]|uniref:taste receptor type 2 member 105-like n=1 Tax=Prinia subflava TaxID=208062 RepID=UPI002FE08354